MMQTPSSYPSPAFAQAFYRHLAEDANAPAFFAADPDDDFRLVHASVSCGRFGTGAVEMGAHVSNWLTPLDTVQLAGAWQRLAEVSETEIKTACTFDGQAGRIAIRLSRWQHEGRYWLAGEVRRIDEHQRGGLQLEHDQALAELRRREQYQHTLLDNSPYFVWLKDEQSRLLAANIQYARVAGVADPRDLEGKTDFDFFPHELAEKYVADDREVMASGQPKNVEEEYCDEHGMRHWMETWKSPLVVDGAVVGTVGCSRDITERKTYEAAIQAQLDLERQHSLMAANLPGFLYTCHVLPDGSFHFPYVSDGILELYGLTPEEVRAGHTRLHAMALTEDVEMLEAALAAAREQGTTFNVEFRIAHPQKGIRWIHAKSSPLAQPDGSTIFYGMMLDITERKQDEQHLRSKSIALAEAQRIARLGSWTLDLIDHCLTWSDEVYRIFEIDPMRFAATDTAFFELVHPEDREAVQQAFDQSLKARQPYQIEHRLLMPDGRVKYVLERGEHRYGPNGDPISTQGTVLDITERKQTELVLHEREAFLNTLLDTLPLPVFYKDRAGRYLGFNRAYEAFFHASKETLLGKTVFDISPKDLAETYAAKDQSLFAQGGLQQYESQVRNAGGELRDVVFTKAVFRDARGDVAGLIGTILDITERKQSETQLKQMVEILEQSVDFIGSASLDGSLLYHNRAARRMLGFAEDTDLTGMRVTDVHPEWANKILQEQAFPTLHEHGVWRGETALLHKDGHEIPVSQLIVLHRDADGRPLYSSTIITDISARKRVEGLLEFIAQGGWDKDVESFLQALTRYLGQTFGMDYVLVDKLSEDASLAETLALYAKGDLLPNMQYSLADTPCSKVMDGLACCYPQGVQQLFPEDRLLVDMGAESYAGQPLLDSTGRVIGLIAVLDGKPIQDIAMIGAILRMVAPRVAAEIERDRAERAIEASRQFLQQIIDTVADPVFVKDRQHRWLLLSDAMCRFMGASRESLLGKSDYDFFPPEQADVFWAKDEEVFVSGTPNVNEESFTDASGLTHTILTTKSCFQDGQGELILVGTIKDITALKQVQLDLENTGYRLRGVLQTIPDYVWMKSVDGVYLACNHAFEKFFGFAEAEIVGKTDYDYVPAELADFFRQKDKEAIDAGAVHINEEWVTLASDGSHVLLETRKVPVHDAAGNVIGILGIGRDITERKRNESRLALQDHALNQINEGLFLLDEEARFVQVNEESCRALGYSREELLTMSIFDIDPDYEAEQWEISRMGENPGMPLTLETRHKTRGGQILNVEVKSTAMTYEGRSYHLCLVRDITERKRVEARLALQDKALNQVGEAIYLIAEDASILQVNQGASRMLGYAQEELLTMRIPDIDPLYNDAVWPVHWADLHRKGTITLETVHRSSTGEIISVEVIANMVEYQGRYLNFALIRDITERKMAQQALAERERELRTLTDNLPDPIFRYDLEGRRTYLNPAAERIAGMAAAALVGFQPSDGRILPENEAQTVLQILRHVAQTGEPAEREMEIVSPNGDVQYYFSRAVAERDDEGRITGVLGIGRNVTPRKLAEQALKQRERELRTLVENLPTYVVRLDRKLCHVYANPAYMSAVGIPEDRLYGLHVSAFWRAENISVEDYVAMLTRVLETGVQDEVTLEWRSERGRFYSHMVRVAPELDAAAQVLGLLVLGFDITAQRREQLLDAERQRVFEAMAHGGELAEVLAQVAGYIDASGRGMRASIMVLDESGAILRRMAAPALPGIRAMNPIDVKTGGNCCAVAALQGQRVAYDHPCRIEAGACDVFNQYRELRACWSEPILSASGQPLGVVTVYLQQPGEPQASDQELLHEAANLCAIAIERKRIEEQMQRHASYDTLTGLPNRRLFGHRLRDEILRAERLGEGVALLFIDLDHFKEVNDSLGHEVGDRLLVEAAERIGRCVRESDTVARLGGDEFVVVLTQVDDVSSLGHTAQNMVDQLAQPFYLDARPIYVSASIGIAGYPLDANDADGLLRCADQAMYVAKQDGRNNFSFFTAAIQQKVHSRLQLAGDLREAMEKGQLQVHYQPIVDIATGEVLKAEALLRWQHPTRGMVPPDVFIPVAEEHGLIHDIGDWVFRQAVTLAQRWNGAAGANSAAPMRQVSVNLSPRQFAKGRIDKTWLEHIESLNADPRSIAIEITEGLLLDDRMDIMEKLARFGMAGMQVALDDFGTGYSAMAYLKKFPIDYLKIDRSFVRDIETDPNDRAIAEAIVVMSRKLGLKVIAEGVETEGQRAILDAVGCEYVQGYLYAKPMRDADFLAFAGVK
jgi:diguanylate cyclase (GGDEF)-like protein/PAS domain S-box-containing protein